MGILGHTEDKNSGENMESIVLLLLNNYLFKIGIITKEEKESIELEILREK